MTEHVNELGQPIGATVEGWSGAEWPSDDVMVGRFCRVERLGVEHLAALFEAFALDVEGRNCTYLPYGPFASLGDVEAWFETWCCGGDPQFWAILDLQTDRAVGVASLMRIKPAAGSIEVGHVHYSPLLQRTPGGTEAMYLMMRRVFELGYRRYEWKCDALNAASRRAAERLGFVFEGVFRQATVVKGRNRDTAWYSVVDGEWGRLRARFEAWLDAGNFDGDGRQRRGLGAFFEMI